MIMEPMDALLWAGSQSKQEAGAALQASGQDEAAQASNPSPSAQSHKSINSVVPISNRSAKLERWGVLLAVLFFFIMGIAYSLIIPPFETPDEPFHYAFTRHIAQGNGLPVQDLQSTGPWHQEGSQAPLYYLVTGLLTGGIDQSDFEALSVRNQSANIGDPLFPGNKNYMRYSGVRPAMTGSNLALHVGRWLSLLLGLATLGAIYGCTRKIVGQRTDRRTFFLPVIALWISAAVPQFLFISASFSNDSLVIAASAVTVFWLLRLLVRPVTDPIRSWELALLGLLLGIAALSKLQGLGLAVLILVAGLWMVWQRQDWRLLLRALLLISAPALFMAGWWYWRNFTLYGDWFGLSNLLSINGQREQALSWRGFVGEFRGLRYSFWGLFGWFNILRPDWFYNLMDILTVVAGAGIVGIFVWAYRGRERTVQTESTRATTPRQPQIRLSVLNVLLLWALLSFGLWLYWTSQATGSQGRLLYPGFVAFTPLLVLGLWWWIRPLPLRLQAIPWVSLVALLVGTSLYGVVVLLPASYAQPKAVDSLPKSVLPADITYGDRHALHVLALDLPSEERFGIGEEVPITLYLGTDEVVDEDYRLFIQLLDDGGQEIANVTTHPGWGRNPTSLWAPGALYADQYAVRIEESIEDRSPLLANVYVGFVDPLKEEQDKLPVTARAKNGEEIVPFLGTVEIAPTSPPTVASAGLAEGGPTFGSVMNLAGYDIIDMDSGDANVTLNVTLLWEANGTPAEEYTVFAHLIDDDGQQVAGFDQAPASGRFPTSYWREGDRILSHLPIDGAEVQPGEYALWVGVYESESQGALRLPVTDAAGFDSGDGMIRLGDVTIP